MSRVLIVGATSRIAEMTARELCGLGYELYLAGRNGAKLAGIASDLRVRGARKVVTVEFDAADPSQLRALGDRDWGFEGCFDVVLVAHGRLSDQLLCQREPERIASEIQVNAASVMEVCERLVAPMVAARRGILLVIASVAGDRGRASNYVYGAAKAALIVYCSGLRQRVHACGVRVVTIMPGPVDTPMTAHMEKGLLFTSPDSVAKSIVRAIRGAAIVAYVPWYWRPIMAVIRRVPHRLFVAIGPK